MYYLSSFHIKHHVYTIEKVANFAKQNYSIFTSLIRRLVTQYIYGDVHGRQSSTLTQIRTSVSFEQQLYKKNEEKRQDDKSPEKTSMVIIVGLLRLKLCVMIYTTEYIYSQTALVV